MRCPPCHNKMTVMDFVDRSAEAVLGWMKGWHCDRCGYRLDPLSEHNRHFGVKSEGNEPHRVVWEVANFPTP